jgi:hypothetical protein
VAIAVGQGGIDQVDAKSDRAAQGEQRFIVGAAEPLLTPDAPRAVPDVADLQVGPAKFAKLQVGV